MTSGPAAGSVADVTATVVLTLISLVFALVAFVDGVLWTGGEAPNLLSGCGPLVVASIGVVLSVTALVRRRRGYVWPLMALGLSLVVWLAGEAVV